MAEVEAPVALDTEMGGGEAPPPPEETGEAPPPEKPKKAVKKNSNVFANFTPDELREYKAGFDMMDSDGDGILSFKDLKKCTFEIGRIPDEEELNGMIAEAPGPVNFTTFLTMIFNRMKSLDDLGPGDDDDTIEKAFMFYAEKEGHIDAAKFKKILMTQGDKFSELDIQNTYEAFEISKGRLNTEQAIFVLTSSNLDEEEEEE